MMITMRGKVLIADELVVSDERGGLRGASTVTVTINRAGDPWAYVEVDREEFARMCAAFVEARR